MLSLFDGIATGEGGTGVPVRVGRAALRVLVQAEQNSSEGCSCKVSP